LTLFPSPQSAGQATLCDASFARLVNFFAMMPHCPNMPLLGEAVHEASTAQQFLPCKQYTCWTKRTGEGFVWLANQDSSAYLPMHEVVNFMLLSATFK